MNDNETPFKATKYDILVAEQGRDGKTYWHRVGVAFPNTKTSGLTVRLYGQPGTFIIKESQKPTSQAALENEDTPF